jgi:phosphotransferase system enzyme I (PtsI)
MMVSVKTDIPQDTILVGIGTSPGIAIGESFSLHRTRMTAVPVSIHPDEVQSEVEQFRNAIQESKNQLQEVRDNVTDQRLLDHLYIIDTHLLILEDDSLVEETIRTIENSLINAAGALQQTIQKFQEIFDSIEDEYLRERRSDVDAVGDRIQCNLAGEVRQSLKDIKRKVVVVAHDLSPADTLQIDRDKIIAFVTDVGGRTSHTSILARSLGVPAIVGLESATSLVPRGVPVIVDGTNGNLILNPSDATFQEYLNKKQEYEYQNESLLAYRELQAVTKDGFKVRLNSNIEMPHDVGISIEQGADGIGLLRSEFLFMGCVTPPEEEEQYKFYRSIIERMAPHPVTIRTLDVGGDKFVSEINLADEANPVMGLRAIRFSLKERTLFTVQLRAILRASAHGPTQILFPMVTGVEETRACLLCLNEARRQLLAENIKMAETVPVGVMIETPSAALVADMIAREVDFLSIGTNDLVQYCLAVDRGNEHVAYLYNPLHPAVLRSLKMICDAATNAGIPVSMCGEMAGDPFYTLILIGFGIKELSMNPFSIPRVKRVLRELDRDDGIKLIQKLMTLATVSEVTRYLEKEMSAKMPLLFAPPQI